MEAKMEKIDVNVVKFEVKVEAAKFSEALTKAYKKNVKKFNVPGFRKGKVPMNVVKQYYGLGVLLEDAVNFAIEESYSEVLKENNIIPVDYPKVDVVQVEEGKDFIYTAEVTVYPEVELGEYKGLSVEKKTYEVTEEEVSKKLKEMQEKNARVETKEEGTVENGNIAVIDFKGFVDGEAFQGGEGHDYSLEIGSKTFIDNFEEQLVGAKVNDTVEVNVTFPESYQAEELAGKPAVFKVKVNGIKVDELPELDDEFASEVSEYETVAEYKDSVKKGLAETKEKNAKDAKEKAAIDAVIADAKMDIPEAMIKTTQRQMMDEFAQRISGQGLSFEQYLQFTGMTEEQMLEQIRPQAELRIKSRLVLEAIVAAEKIEATEEDFEQEIAKMAEMYQMEADKAKELIGEAGKAEIMKDLAVTKAAEFVRDNAKESKSK